MKRLSKLLAVVLITLSISTPVLAQNSNIRLPDKVTLISDKGIQYEMTLQQESIPSINRRTNEIEEYSITYSASTDNMVLMSPMTRGSYNDDMWDDSNSVKFSMTLTFKRGSDINGILLTKVSGNYKTSQADISVTNQSVAYHCDLPAAGIFQSGGINPKKSSFSKGTGFTKYVSDSDNSLVSAAWTGKIKRGSTWRFEFPISLRGL